MSELRKQLEAARAEYLAHRYAGDLAADVLDGRARVIVLRRFVAAASALAAMVVLAIVLWPGSETGSKVASKPAATTQRVLVAESSAADEADASFSLTGVDVPDMASPSGMSVVPSFGSLTGLDVPRITDVIPEKQETTTTTTEKTL